MKLIDKDALVAEINSRININETCQKINGGHEFYRGAIDEAKEILSFIDTLEVKEMDLEKEYKDFVEKDPVYNKLVNGIVGKAIAKHFFELGLNTQHSSINIPNIDNLLEEDGIDPNSKEAKIFKESYYLVLEKLKGEEI